MKPPASASGGAPRAKILIVDDDERNAFAAIQALEELGHEMVVAKSGEEALRRLLDEEYAVILLDLHMPGMDGYETAALIRSRKRTRGTPIVFLTAVFRDEHHTLQAYSAGAVDIVFKPVDPFILRSKVSVLVELHLKTMEIKREAERRQRLLEENARVHAEKLAAERALRRTQERQESILRSLPIVFQSRSAEPPYAAAFVSDSIQPVTGFAPDRFTSEPEFVLNRVHPEDRDVVTAALAAAATTGAYACEFRWLCEDGQYRVFLEQGVLGPEEEGKARELVGTLVDNTDRRSLEQQLAQAQKMEAVGQLTGGVAHDFNNLLTVVLGNVDLLLRKLDMDSRTERQLGAIRHAADRGRSLTRQLLAFSRRQHLTPVTLDVGGLVSGFLPLMQQAVGESVTIRADLMAENLCVHADPAQLETALLNLAVNARDAMPDGGELTVTAAKVGGEEAGRKPADADAWIRIDVVDSGTGIPPEVLERVFEPFFTTKEVGKGSGLGLSQVYGFVNQSGGFVNAESSVGAGTRFQLYLPASEQPAAARPAHEEVRALEVGGSERILVVEDDEPVLALTVEMLTGLGYQVNTAINAEAALAVLRSGAEVDLIFSDVVMPGGVSGIQLAKAAREMRPDVKILLTSGYVGDAAIDAGEFEIIDKPYERSHLAGRLRELLGEAVAEPPRRARRAARAAS